MKVTTDTAIGFIGTGVMGASMAGHLLEAGYDLHVYNRTRSRAQDLVSRGAKWHDSVSEVAQASDVVFTIVGFPPDVEEVYLGPNGVVQNARSGTVLVDMTTSSPALAIQIANAAEERDCAALDAPVSGGDTGAREARLSIMVGGEREAYDAVLPLFQIMGANIVYQGKAGSGQHTKMCNQIAIASGMLGVCEAIAYAKKAGLDPDTVLSSIESGAAGSWSLSNLGPRMIAGNFDPGFYVKHFIKDMDIAAAELENMGLDAPGLAQARALYKTLQSKGHGDDGTQALFKLYQAQLCEPALLDAVKLRPGVERP